jgi:RNA polymerase sigma-70 factor (ECF subfamily)
VAAEDLALEAFWRLYRRPPRDLNLAGWLYRVATHLGLNALRSRKRRRRYEEEAGALEFPLGSPLDPAAQVEATEQRRAVQQALAIMSSRSAQLLLLRHSGLTYAETAAALGVAASSIGTLLAPAQFQCATGSSKEGEHEPVLEKLLLRNAHLAEGELRFHLDRQLAASEQAGRCAPERLPALPGAAGSFSYQSRRASRA